VHHAISVFVASQAIRSDNPIIFFEHVLLYNIKGETHDGDYCQSLERAEVRCR
jgi:pyruvate dehydrogenase E1 component beta subunit